MNKLLKRIFFGDIAIKEYVTITVAEPIKESAYLKNEKNFIDISENHWLLCLEPIVFGVWLNKNDSVLFDEAKEIRIYFSDSALDYSNAEKKSVAILTLNLFHKIEDVDGVLLLLKLQKSKINHLSIFKTLILFWAYYKKPTLPFQKFKGLVAAFSFPRKVRLISYNEDDYYNIFPMDLLGEIKNCNKYVFGLRHSNTALPKIIRKEKIVVSEVSFKYKNIIYELGKHHSTNPPLPDSLPFKLLQTSNLNFYIPEWINSYKEIKVLRTLNLGSQMLMWGQVINEEALKSSEGNLFHIHFLYYLYQQKKRKNYQLV